MPTQEPLFTVLNKVDSTNNYAMQQVNDQMAIHGACYFALQQTAGRGQRGKTWHGEPGSHIALSVLLKIDKDAATNQFPFSAAMALAARAFLQNECTEPIKIKWPNDIYWRDRKAGGILIENKISGNAWKWAVTGIGVNINETAFGNDLPNPVSLKQITGNDYNIIELGKKLHRQVLVYFEKWQNTPAAETVSEYNRFLYKRNEKAKLKKNNAIFETLIKAVNEAGQLEGEDEAKRLFNFGEVEWLL